MAYYPVVIIQPPLSSSSSTTSSSTPTTNSSTPNTTPATQTKPAVRLSVDGLTSFIYTGRPQGGNPHGGPEQMPNGYVRIDRGGVSIHNTGGQRREGAVSGVGLEGYDGKEGEGEGEGGGHTEGCRRRTMVRENWGLCFCPAR